MLKRLFSLRRPAAPPPTTLPAGVRVYAIGDIHGRLDLLDSLLAQIDADDAASAPAETLLIFLGDLVDRGPDSAGVVERVRRLAQERAGVRVIAGNHEELLLAAMDGEPQALRVFCRVGGRETLLSYGLPASDYEAMDYGEVRDALVRLVPPEHRTFIESFEDSIVLGDYAFVHAGVRPGVPFDQQKSSDLRWIREPFLGHGAALEQMVVHGHTISEAVEQLPHRIGIDTGAYASGVLTALRLEGEDRRILATA